MLTIELSFPSNRYHATPWNRHVNEGEVEWPPSPWRILRALIANWHLKARDEIPEHELVALIEQLSSSLPRYAVPRGVIAHTRHYMPGTDAAANPSKTFDGFVRLPTGAKAYVQWPDIDLTRAHSAQLGLLLERMSYLGRAESLVVARLVETGGETGETGGETAGETAGESWVVPAEAATSESAAPPGSGQEFVSLLAPLPHQALVNWRQGVVDQRMADKLRAEQAKKAGATVSAKERRVIEDSTPDSAFAVLTVETTDLHKQGWTRPPGSRWVLYTRDTAGLRTTTGPRARRVRAGTPTTARFAVTSKLAPRLTDVLSVAERVRKGLLKHSDGAGVFSGRTPEKTLLKGHRHVFVLPEANSATGRITHITLHAGMGFSDRARVAIERLQRVWNRHETMTLALLGVGEASVFAGMDTDAGQCPLLVGSRLWVSRTPFVPTRHAKTSRDGRPKHDDRGLQIGSPEHDLRRLLRENGYPEPLTVTMEPDTRLGGKPTRWTAYRTRRSDGHGQRGNHSGYGFKLSFAEPVIGPLCFGYAAHLGLGLFEPMPEPGRPSSIDPALQPLRMLASADR